MADIFAASHDPWPGGVWDPATGYYIKPNSDGSLNVNATVTPAAVQPVDGQTASGVAVANPPVTIGGRAATIAPVAVADGQVVNAMFSKTGKQVVIGALRTMKSDQKTTISASTAETTIIAAGGAGVFNDPYMIALANSGASTTKVDIRDDTGGTIRATIEVPAGDTRGFALPVDSGLSQAVANKVWTAQCSVATTALEVTAMFAVNT